MNAEDAYGLLACSVRAVVGAAGADFSLVLALSGGRDSMTLLNVLARLNLKSPLRAVHVHHGLSAHADDWEHFCRLACERVGVAFDCVRLDGVSRTAGNLEARARRLRYQALYQFTRAPGALLTAHHLDDQVETYLYRHCRGTGVRGAGAMSPSAPSPVAGVRLMRPLLAVAGQTIADCACAMNVQWIEDEQNRDERFERNWIRHRLHPMLRQRFGSIDTVIGHNADLFRRAARLCTDLACSDYTNAHEEYVNHSPAIFSLEPSRLPADNASFDAVAAVDDSFDVADDNVSPGVVADNASLDVAIDNASPGSISRQDYTGATTHNASPDAATHNASPGATHNASPDAATHNASLDASPSPATDDPRLGVATL
ncbi:MAG: tRNA lysidine(34) synthetase TilS, partial [Proteobacteria bacterium]|nr:tRNA lysidine(34) synthetase TilS [Pseudomonadota bacterium]